MSLWLEISFLKRVQYRLDSPVIKMDGSTFVMNCKCPICGDSKKKKNKKRGYFYSDSGVLYYKCWNCGVSTTFDSFLKDFDPALHNVFRMESYRERTGRDPQERDKIEVNDDEFKTSIVSILTEAKVENIFEGCIPIKDLPQDHIVVKYLEGRKLPKSIYHKFFLAEKFVTWAKTNTDRFESEHYSDFGDHPRIVIPWIAMDGTVFGYQARSLNGEEPKYYTIILDPSYDKIYGMDRINLTRRILVVEGPIDSMFLPNGVAVGSSSLTSFDDKGLDVVYCWDNEPRNPDILKLIDSAISRGKKVFIPPAGYKSKDINQAVEDGYSPKEIFNMINGNTYSGLSAKMALSAWRKFDEPIKRRENNVRS